MNCPGGLASRAFLRERTYSVAKIWDKLEKNAGESPKKHYTTYPYYYNIKI